MKKSINTFRVIIYGDSNTYGASTLDSDTYPKKLEELLQNKFPSKNIEVWNGGITASVLDQKIAYAALTIPKLKPDLVIFQDFHNFGRVPFLAEPNKVGKNKFAPKSIYKYKIEKLFKNNHELYHQNIPHIFLNKIISNKVHIFLIQYSSLYRAANASFLSYYSKVNYPNSRFDCTDETRNCKSIDKAYVFAHKDKTKKLFLSFIKQHREVPIFFSTHSKVFFVIIKNIMV